MAACAPSSAETYGAPVRWQPTTPRLRPLRLVVSWVVAAAVASTSPPGIVAGRRDRRAGGAFLVAAAIAVVNAVLPPMVAALRLPFTLVTGFLLVLFVDAAALMLADELFPEVARRSTRSATRCSPRW